MQMGKTHLTYKNFNFMLDDDMKWYEENHPDTLFEKYCYWADNNHPLSYFTYIISIPAMLMILFLFILYRLPEAIEHVVRHERPIL